MHHNNTHAILTAKSCPLDVCALLIPHSQLHNFRTKFFIHSSWHHSSKSCSGDLPVYFYWSQSSYIDWPNQHHLHILIHDNGTNQTNKHSFTQWHGNCFECRKWNHTRCEMKSLPTAEPVQGLGQLCQRQRERYHHFSLSVICLLLHITQSRYSH